MAAAGYSSSVATVQTLIPEMFRRYFEAETKGLDDQRDDFFSGYQAGVEAGVVGSMEQLQVGQDLAADVDGSGSEVFTFDSDDTTGTLWADDFQMQ